MYHRQCSKHRQILRFGQNCCLKMFLRLFNKLHFHLWVTKWGGDLKEKSHVVVTGTMLRERVQIEFEWRFSAPSGEVAEQDATVGVFATFRFSCHSVTLEAVRQTAAPASPPPPTRLKSHERPPVASWPELTGRNKQKKVGSRFDLQGLTSSRASRSCSSGKVESTWPRLAAAGEKFQPWLVYTGSLCRRAFILASVRPCCSFLLLLLHSGCACAAPPLTLAVEQLT